MKLTAKGRYAVTALTDMAVSGEGVIVSLAEISRRQKISLSFLEQLFRKLRKTGLVESLRGADGGYKLARSPSDISLNQIIAAVDEEIKAHGCSADTQSSCTGLSGRCLTHNLWGALEAHIEGFLSDITIADVVAGNLPQEMEAAQ